MKADGLNLGGYKNCFWCYSGKPVYAAERHQLHQVFDGIWGGLGVIEEIKSPCGCIGF